METLLPRFAGPVIVTVVYLSLYYGLLTRLLTVKTERVRTYRERGEEFDRYFGHDRVMLAADRAALNVLEQMPPFLVLLWLYAVFVSVPSATLAGGVYLAARALHPFMLGRNLGGMIRNRVLIATVPAYLVLAYLGITLLVAALRSLG